MVKQMVRRGDILQFSDYPLRHGFSTKRMGNMSFRFDSQSMVLENRTRLYESLGVRRMIEIAPQHGGAVHFVGPESYDLRIPCDALFTSEDIFLQLNPADCFPVYMTGAGGRWCGLVHAGRKSVDCGIVEESISGVARNFGERLSDILVAIGPGIQKCCYGGEELASELRNKPSWAPHITEGPLGFRADLLDYVVSRLREAGVSLQKISVASSVWGTPLCTGCAIDSDGTPLFYSHRRSIETGEPEGRFAALVRRQ